MNLFAIHVFLAAPLVACTVLWGAVPATGPSTGALGPKGTQLSAEAADGAIERLRVRLSSDFSWQNGIEPLIDLPPTASTEQVVSKVFDMTTFDQGRVKRHETLKQREVQIRGSLPDRYVAVVVATNLGEKIVLLRHQGGAVGWWSRVYDANISPAETKAHATTANAKIGASIERLTSPRKDERAAAVRALIDIGTPAAAALVTAIHDPRNDLRALAAEALRSILAADPSAAPNFHDRKYWEKQVAEVKVGTSWQEAIKSLLPDASPEERKAALQMGAWSGQSGVSILRLDDYWTATLQLVNLGQEKLSQPPKLESSVRSAWVQPPPDYTGAWVTWFVNGQQAQEIVYRNGQYDGTFTAFHDNGSKSWEQHFRSGVCDGTDSGWYRAGRKMYEGQYRNGKQEGRWQHWYEDGKKQCVRDYREGQLSGVYIDWFPSGQKRFEKHYRNDTQHGVDTLWDEQGKMLWERNYRNGKLVEPGDNAGDSVTKSLANPESGTVDAVS